MPDCRKSHLIFQNFLGRPPAGARAFGTPFGASPPYLVPLSNIPGSAPAKVHQRGTLAANWHGRLADAMVKCIKQNAV